ncbi:hypothetical protein CPB86DRAFT_806025, partial [Serendipita vermifera]
MRPAPKKGRERMETHMTISDSDEDPDFVRGPTNVTKPASTKVVKSGKKRTRTGPAKKADRPNKRRKLTKDPANNPLIELLGVEDDDYFQYWNSDGYNTEDGEALFDELDSQEGFGLPTRPHPREVKPHHVKAKDPDATQTEDTVTEEDDDWVGNLSRSLIEEDLDEIVKKSTQQVSRAEARKLKLMEDPSATESDSDDLGSPTHYRAPPSPQTVCSQDIDGEDLEPKPQFDEHTRPRDIGPLVLDASDNIEVPSSINKYLRGYQREGVEFLWNQFKQGRGGILGDDMGLGKTIQVISFLSAIMKKHGDKRDLFRRHFHTKRLMDEGHRLPRSLQDQPALVLPPANTSWPTCLLVAPVPLLPNWKHELDTWGYFDVEVFEPGSSTAHRTRREDLIRQFRHGRADIVLISMDSLLRQFQHFSNLDFSLIIVDEVHRIKNPHSKLLKALQQFKCETRFGLTGTAIQNNYEELWTLLDWSNPGSVGTKSQWQWSVSAPLKKGQSTKATLEEQRRAQIVAKNLVDKLLKRFFLRRTKKLLVHQLPKKIDQVAFCPLTKEQRMVYKRFLATEEMQNMLQKDEECDCGSHQRRSKCCHPIFPKDLLEFISIFIKISNSLVLIMPQQNESEQARRIKKKLQAIAFPNKSTGELLISLNTDAKSSCGKWRVLQGLLEQWQEENNQLDRIDASGQRATSLRRNKVLIFTRSRKLLEFIQFTMDYEGYNTRQLQGDMKPEDRQKSIMDFQNDPEVFIFLITTQTGGVGLNLTAANKVIIFDPSWNPANDLQAMDRAFRIGQVRDVEVYRLLAAGSIEELIYKRQLYKQQMMMIGYEASAQTRYFEGVQGAKGMEGELFGVKNLFALSETGDMKQQIEQARLDEDLWRQKMVAGHNSSELGDAGMIHLLTDSPEDALRQREKKEKIYERLRELGAAHIHSNEELLRTSHVEQAKFLPRVHKTHAVNEEDGSADASKPRWKAPKRPNRR